MEREMRRSRTEAAGPCPAAIACFFAAALLGGCENGLDAKIRAEVEEQANAELSGLSILVSSDGSDYRSLSDFDLSTDAVRSVQINDAGKFGIKVTTAEPGATITATYGSGSVLTIASGTMNLGLPVTAGTSSIAVKVTSANGLHTRTYAVTAYGGCFAGPRPELKGPNNVNSDSYGGSVAVSADGSMVAVGADSLYGDYSTMKGRAYLYTLSGGSWSEAAALTSDTDAEGDLFGTGVSVSPDGSTVACGQNDYSGMDLKGILNVFRKSGASWNPYSIQPGSTEDYMGWSNALSRTGSVIAAGARNYDGTAVDQGRVYVYAFSGTALSLMAGSPLENPSPLASDGFGTSVSISSDGTVLAAGASGANEAHVFRYSASTWGSSTAVVPSGLGPGAQYGASVSLSSDATTLVVGAPGSDAAYVFAWNATGSTWNLLVTLHAPTASTSFGASVAISGDGSTLLVGAPGSGSSAGYVCRYAKSGSTYSLATTYLPQDSVTGDRFGCSVALSTDGSVAAIGAWNKRRAYIF